MNFRRWTITVFLSIAVFSGLAAFKVFEIKAAIAFGQSFPKHSETVETTEITTVTYTPSINVIGDVLAPQHINIRNELPGQIAIVNFVSGEYVTKGQVLLQFDISIEEANLVAARARAELSRSVHKRAKNLHKSKAISQEQLDRSKADLATSLAEIKVRYVPDHFSSALEELSISLVLDRFLSIELRPPHSNVPWYATAIQPNSVLLTGY